MEMRSFIFLLLEGEKGQEGMKRIARLKVWVDEREKTEPVDYVRCQWQKSNKSVAWLIYRLLVTLWFIETLVLSFVKEPPSSFPFWPIYYTHWSLTIATIQAIISFALVTMHQAGKFSPGGGKHQDRVCKVYEWIFAAAVAMAMTVSIVYWVLVFNPHKNDTLEPIILSANLQVHALNSVVMIIDLSLVAFSVRMVGVILPMTITGVYVIFNAIYCISGGTTYKGQPYIYKILDWRKPAIAAPMSLLCPITVCLLYQFVWWLSYIRRRWAAKREQKKMDEALSQSAAQA